MSGYLAELVGAHKRFDKTIALDGVDIGIKRGELVALLGPNGAGKTTTISLLLGLSNPDAGWARLFGESPQKLEPRRRIGVMMQEVHLSEALKVRELIETFASYYPNPYSVKEVMALTRTTEFADRQYRHLSGGQKRQVQFAIALCGRPELLFLDEPTVGLDIQARQLMWETIRDLIRRGCSIILTTHYIEEAEALADRVIILAKGRVVANGSVSEMRGLVKRTHISCMTQLPLESIKAIPAVENVRIENSRVLFTARSAEDVVRQLLAADGELTELEVRRAGLSEVFVDITEEHRA